MSKIRFFSISNVSSQIPVVPNFSKSGLNVILVYSLFDVPILGLLILLRFFSNVCVYFLPSFAVSTIKYSEKIAVSLAPRPLRPPVVLF